jgi:hypothetical protein
MEKTTKLCAKTTVVGRLDSGKRISWGTQIVRIDAHVYCHEEMVSPESAFPQRFPRCTHHEGTSTRQRTRQEVARKVKLPQERMGLLFSDHHVNLLR